MTASRRKWPALLVSPLSFRGRLACLATALVWMCGAIGASIVVVTHPHYMGDCSSTAQIFNRPRHDKHAVFTGTFIHMSRWGVVVRVKEHFWGLSPLNARYAFLGGDFNRHPRFLGQTYLFDASRVYSWVPGAFSAVELRNCGRTFPESLSQHDLRVLREGPQPGVRITGQVLKHYADNWEPLQPAHVAGEEVVVSGPDGEFVLITDDRGVFDKKGLPDGEYRVRLKRMNPGDDEPQRCWNPPSERDGDAFKRALVSGEVWGCTLSVYVKR